MEINRLATSVQERQPPNLQITAPWCEWSNPVNGLCCNFIWCYKTTRGGGVVSCTWKNLVLYFLRCCETSVVISWAVVTSWSETGGATSYEPGSYKQGRNSILLSYQKDKTINPSKSLTTIITSTFPEMNGSPLKIGPKGKGEIQNHPFSGAMLVSGRDICLLDRKKPSPTDLERELTKTTTFQAINGEDCIIESYASRPKLNFWGRFFHELYVLYWMVVSKDCYFSPRSLEKLFFWWRNC